MAVRRSDCYQTASVNTHLNVVEFPSSLVNREWKSTLQTFSQFSMSLLIIYKVVEIYSLIGFRLTLPRPDTTIENAPFLPGRDVVTTNMYVVLD